MDKKLLARRIRQYRQLAKMSQETLADKVGKSDTYIRKMEAGDRTPSLELLVSLAMALNTTPNHLLLSASRLNESTAGSIMEVSDDCTPTELAILYENMTGLKRLLRTHLK